MEKSKIVKYKGNEYTVGLAWKEINGDKPSVIRGRIKDTISRQKYDGFGTKIEANKTKVQIGFSNKKAKGIPSLAKIFASQDDFKDSIVIVKIQKDLFWTVGITEEGLIVAGQDSLYSTTDFIDTIGAELQLADDLNIFIADDCVEEVTELLSESLADVDASSFDIDLALSGNHKNEEIDLVYNKTVDSLVQGGATLGFAVVATLGYFYVIKEDPTYGIITGEVDIDSGEVPLTEKFMIDHNKFKKNLKKSNKSTTIDAGSVEVLAKTEILKERNATYDNKEIFDNIQRIFNMFSIYLVEWEFESIKYQNIGSEYFTIKYSRIKDSYGFKKQLEEEVAKIMTMNNIGSDQYRLSYGNTTGDILLINLQFKKPKAFNLNQGEITEEDTDKQKNEYAKKLKKIENNILSYQDDVMNFGFFDKRFGSKLSEYEDSIRMELNKAKKIFKEIKKAEKDFNSQEIDFDETLIGGTRSDMLSMMQQYSYYSWSELPKAKQFPQVKARSKKQVQAYAKAYEFIVTPGGNMDVLGLRGLNEIILNDKLLNKNHVKIKEVTFNLSNEVWEIKGETYEKI